MLTSLRFAAQLERDDQSLNGAKLTRFIAILTFQQRLHHCFMTMAFRLHFRTVPSPLIRIS